MIDLPYDRILEIVSLRNDMIEKLNRHKVVKKLWNFRYKLQCKSLISSFRKGDIYGERITILNLLNFTKFAYQAKYKYPIHVSINVIEGDNFCTVDFKNISTILSVSDISRVISVTQYHYKGEFRIDFSKLWGEMAREVYDEIMNYTIGYLLGDEEDDQTIHDK